MLTRRDLALMIGPLVLAGVLSSSGCTTIGLTATADATTPVSKAMDAEALYRARTAYLSDNSKVMAQVQATDLNALAGYRIALETEAGKPMRLGILVQKKRTDDATVFTSRMRCRAALWLACTTNADAVYWTDEANNWGIGELTRSQANALAGGTVTDFATSPQRLLDLAQVLEG